MQKISQNVTQKLSWHVSQNILWNEPKNFHVKFQKIVRNKHKNFYDMYSNTKISKKFKHENFHEM